MPKRIIFVRHGQTDHNVAHKLMGWETPARLNQQGLSDAKRVAERLTEYEIQALYHSDLLRTTETASIISERIKASPRPSFYLRERNLGIFAEMTFGEIQETMPEMWTKFLDHHDPDWNGLCGESLRDVRNRFASLMTDLEVVHAEDTVLLVTHSGYIYTILRDYFAFFDKDSFEEVGHSSITVVDRVDGSYQLTAYNS